MSEVWRINDAEWVKRRKAMWLANKAYYSLSGSCKVIEAKKKYFMTGVKENVYKSGSYVDENQYLDFDWNDVNGVWEQLRLLPKCDVALVDSLINALRSSNGNQTVDILFFLSGFRGGPEAQYAQEWTGSEFGFMDGMERDLFNYLLPPKFDVEAWRQEVSDNFAMGRTYLSPLESFNMMVEAGYGFMTHFVANPHHPIQDFVDYWAQTVPYFNFDEPYSKAQGQQVKPKRKCENAKAAAKELCQVVRFFKEPRGLPQENSAAKRFRDKLFDVFEHGTGNAIWDELWAQTAQPEGGHFEFESHRDGRQPERVLVGQKIQPRVLRQIHAAWQTLGYTAEVFEPERIRAVNAKRVLNHPLAASLGYLRTDPVLAYHYVFAMDKQCVTSPKDISVDVHLLWVLPKQTADEANCLPIVAVFYAERFHEDYAWPVTDTLCSRHVSILLARQNNLYLSRPYAEDPIRKELWPKNYANQAYGVEYFSSLPFETVTAENTKVKQDGEYKVVFHQYQEVDEAACGMNAARFQAEVMSELTLSD